MSEIDWDRVEALARAENVPEATNEERQEAAFYMLSIGVEYDIVAVYVGTRKETVKRWQKKWGLT